MKTVSIYISDSEFKTYFCELVDQQYAEPGPSHFITFTPRMEAIWHDYPWDSRTRLPWVPGKGLKRQLKLAARLRQIQAHFTELCKDAERIYIHTYQIFSERVNCVIAHLIRTFPGADIRVRLIPDGMLNLRRKPMSGWRKFPQWFNRLKWSGYADITPFSYSGDRLGADAAICDRIYLPNNFPSEYDPQKIHYVQMPLARHDASAGRLRTALVLGTALVAAKILPAPEGQAIAQGIAKVLADLDIKDILYKPHPSEPADALELWSPGQEVVETKLCLERYVVQQPFDVVVSCCSTGLLTSKLVQPNLEVYSVGLNLLEQSMRRSKSLHNFRDACEKLGISLVPTSLVSNSNENSSSLVPNSERMRNVA